MRIKEYIRNHINHKVAVYAGFWIIMILLPVVSTYLALSSRNVSEINWSRIADQWYSLVPFLLIFLVNCIWLVPRQFMRQHYAVYITSIVLLTLSTFSIVQILSPTERGHEMQRQEMRNGQKMPMHENDFGPRYEELHERPMHMPGPPPKKPGMPLRNLFFGPFIGDMFVVLLLVSFNIAVELFFKSQKDKLAIKELKYNEVQTQLDYLKYQINPHFFMNTLNNIHALVDIDTEKAKQTIVELSKLMRYLLYDSDKRLIPLDDEINFLRHYIELMRIRYPEDMVRIIANMPSSGQSVVMPPLLFISFVENAFKHGVSFRTDSYVNVEIIVDNKMITFHCVNSNTNRQKDQHHGIGLDNIRQRLELLYPSRYILSINELPSEFSVLLSIPAIKATDTMQDK